MTASRTKNRILAVGVLLTLLLSLLPQPAFSATKEVTTTYYRLDTGVTFLWKNSAGAWQNGREPGGAYSHSRAFNLPANARNVKVYAYNGSNFTFGNGGFYEEGNGNTKKVYNWNPTAYAWDENSYEECYYNKSASPLTVSGADTYIPANGNLTVTYNATYPKGDRAYNVKNELEFGGQARIYALLDNPSQEVINAMNLLDSHSQNFSPNVEGYLWFLPIVIQYERTEEEEVPDDAFDAILDLPKSAKINETYTAKDISEIGAGLTVKVAELTKRVVGESTVWSPVATWPGRGKGQNTGGKKDEKASKPCEIEYRLVVELTDGRKDDDIKKIKIYEDEAPPEEDEDQNTNPDVSLNAVLSMPDTVYEGHFVIASDQSSYVVDGKSYSADAAYNQFGARHEFRPSPGAGAQVNGNYESVYTDAKITWPVVGDYEVTLRISLKGNSDTDTKPIEVLRTPAIIDSLGGAQKQNRKQTLTASIATNPLYPVKNAWMEITDKATGEIVRLSMGGSLVNSDNIKTRAIEDISVDQYYTVLEFPFLTKFGETREFTYTIFAEDTRGQTDTVTRDFTVVPDLPPVPAIFLPTEFLREKGTNVARIEAEDRSEADSGDQLERTWGVSYKGPGGTTGFVNPQTMAGFEDLSFGTGQSIAFEKTGVGPVEAKIHVKDVWTDETLPEYIKDSDYLSAESEVYTTVVENIAPVVTLSARPTKSADLLLLAASDAEYDALSLRKNEIDRALIEKGIDAKLNIKKLDKPAGSGFMNNAIVDVQSTNLFTQSVDDQLLYTFVGTHTATGTLADTSTWYGARKGNVGAPYYLTAYDVRTGGVKWRYTFSAEVVASRKITSFGHDSDGKYLYFTVKNSPNPLYAGTSPEKTYLFDKKTGTFLKTFDSAFGAYNHAANNAVYTLAKDGVYKHKLSGGAATKIFTGNISGEARLVSGKIRFFAQIASNAYIGDFNPDTEKVELTELAGISAHAENTAVCIDSDGKSLITAYTNVKSGSNTILKANTTFFDKMGRATKTVPVNPIAIKDGAGKMTHAAAITDGRFVLYDLYSDKSYTHNQRDNENGWASLRALFGFKEEDGAVSVQAAVSTNELGSGWGQSLYHYDGRPAWYSVNTASGAVTCTTMSKYMAYSNGIAEFGSSSNALYAAGWSADGLADQPLLNDVGLRATVLPRNEDQILAQTALSFLTADPKDLKSTILLDDSGSVSTANGSLFGSALGNASFVKLTDSSSVLLAKTIAERVTAEGVASQKTTVIKKTEGAAEGSINRTFALDPQKTYYYEYEAAGNDSKTSDPLSFGTISSKLATLTDGLYVQATYFEDFGGGDAPGFVFNKAGISEGVYQGGDAIAFTVPKGQYGVLSFDYEGTCDADAPVVISLDGANIVAISPKYVTSGSQYSGSSITYAIGTRGAGKYVHKTLLSEGTHIIRGPFYRSYRGSITYMRLDNLKFEILGTAPPPDGSWSTKKEDAGGGWTKYTGSFVTPNAVIAYEGQPIRSYTGHYTGSPFYVRTEDTVSADNKYYTTLYFNIPAGLRVFENAIVYAGASDTTVAYPFANVNEISRRKGDLIQLSQQTGEFAVVGIPYQIGPNNKPVFGDHSIKYINESVDIANDWYFFDIAGTKVYTSNETYTATNIAFSLTEDTQKLRNFSLYTIEDGVRIYVTRDSIAAASELAQWRTENAAAAVVDEKPTGAEKEKGALVYKKGQLVAVNIGYTDYESDPSKAEFWRYTHTPFNDGEHPDAAVILSRTGETLKVFDKVLPARIDRFYIDGKYVVEHWQRDNTDRTDAGNTAVNYEDFNKYSNTETLTFYIEGGGEAPWVTGIKTNPDPVKEGGQYTITAGVDDLEKDDLNVLIEVYFEGEKVYEYYEEGVKADEAGNYPPVVTGLAPTAKTGDYTVVVTVWDEDGTGLGDHSFLVITEGRIEGEVRHTALWDENRKRYNLKLFGEEVNRASAFAAYAALPAPRPRGVNVFWSGERFMLEAAVAGDPLSVTCAISGYPAYRTIMTDTGRRNAADERIYEGSLWNSDMINRWGRTAPVLLTFVFTAYYEGDISKTHEATVIVDTYEDYRQLHRYY